MKRILIVDDELNIRDVFVKVLKREGYAADAVASGKEAMEVLKSEKYGLVFLDLRMPGWNGVQVLEMIRELYKSLPVYISTGFYPEYLTSLKTVSDEGLDFEVIEKPIGRSQIMSVVKGVFAEGG